MAIERQWQAEQLQIQAEQDSLLMYQTTIQTVEVFKDPSFAVHTVLDVVGVIPVIGEVADGLNAAIYALEGDYTNAALSLAGMVPFAGAAVTGANRVSDTTQVAVTTSRITTTIPTSAATPPLSAMPTPRAPEIPTVKTPEAAPVVNTPEAAPMVKAPEPIPTASVSGKSADETVTVYRAVSRAEAADIAENGFRPGPNSMETKLFTDSPQSAAEFGLEMVRQGDEAVFEVVEVSVPRSLIDEVWRGTTDGGRVTYGFDLAHQEIASQFGPELLSALPIL